MSTNTLGNYESMSIAASGNPCLEQATKKVFQERITNYLEDIDGSQHKNKYEKFYRDTIIMNSTGDDSIISRNKQTRRENVRDALFIDDIDGVRRRVKDKMIETKRCINPLEPDYKLPEIEIRVHTPPRFLRDSTRLDDIVGSSPVPLYRSKQRDPLKISDIPGTKYVPKVIVEREVPFCLDQSLFLKPNFADTTSRHINPMEPCYEFRGMKIHDNPRDIKPKRLKPFLSETTGLYTADISGAQVKESRAKSLRHPRDSISIQDIDGAQANTLKRTIVSSRCSDPVCPTYKSLDGNGILEEPPHKPMIPSHIMATSHTNNAGALAEVNNKSNIITKQITDSNSIASYAATKLPTTSPPILAEPTDLTIASDHSNSNHSAFKDQQSYKPTHAGIFDHYSNLPTCPSLEKVSRVNVFGKNARRSGEFGSIADTPSSTLSASAIQDILKQTTRPHLTSSISNTKPRAMKITSRLQSIESQYTGNSAMSMNSNQRKAYQELRDEVAAVRRLKL